MTNFNYTHSWDGQSEAIQSLFYDAEREALAVVFHTGAEYEYLDVPQSVWSILDAPHESAGRWYNREIYGQYTANARYFDNYVARPTIEQSTIQADAIKSGLIGSANVLADSDTLLSVEYRNNYTVRFSTGGIESVFNTVAGSDVEAEKEFDTLTQRLGLVVDTARVERELT
jgi:hypothetical protein